MRWNKDLEERAAITKKAHDAYALARKLEGQIAALEARVKELEEYTEIPPRKQAA